MKVAFRSRKAFACLRSARIDWGDGTIEVADLDRGSGAGSFSGTHAYQFGGIYEITVSLADDDTGLAIGSTTALITGAGLHDGVLQIVGTSGKDDVSVKAGGRHGHGDLIEVKAKFLTDNGHKRTFGAEDVGSIVVLLGGGRDKAKIDKKIEQPALIDGGAGDDSLRAGGGPTDLHGGEGNDKLVGGDAGDRLFGDGGNDRLSGGKGDDLLDGGGGEDRLDGGRGNDTLRGGAHNDWLRGGRGDDRLEGGDGADLLEGDRGDDTLLGQDGDDLLFGGHGKDLLDGGSGHDALDGGSGRDELRGGEGNDLLVGGRGGDVLQGGDGDDQLSGGSGQDWLDGGSGSDDAARASRRHSDVLVDIEGTLPTRHSLTRAVAMERKAWLQEFLTEGGQRDKKDHQHWRISLKL